MIDEPTDLPPQKTHPNQSTDLSGENTKSLIEQGGDHLLKWLQYITIGPYYLMVAKKHPIEDQISPPKKPEVDFTLKNFDTSTAKPKQSNKVFIRYCSKDPINKAVKKLCAEEGLETVNLENTVTIMQPLDMLIKKSLDVTFAIALLSGEDFVYAKDSRPAEAKLQSRQNTVFELGVLFGGLDKGNVFVLYHDQKSFLMPSTGYNPNFTPFDKAGHWRKILLQRLSLAGYNLKSIPKTQSSTEAPQDKST